MRAETVAIDELALRVPGLTPVEGRELAGMIACYLADHLPAASADRDLGQLELRLTSAPNISLPSLAETIGKAILARMD